MYGYAVCQQGTGLRGSAVVHPSISGALALGTMERGKTRNLEIKKPWGLPLGRYEIYRDYNVQIPNSKITDHIALHACYHLDFGKRTYDYCYRHTGYFQSRCYSWGPGRLLYIAQRKAVKTGDLLKQRGDRLTKPASRRTRRVVRYNPFIKEQP